jgi:hypothetical protein
MSMICIPGRTFRQKNERRPCVFHFSFLFFSFKYMYNIEGKVRRFISLLGRNWRDRKDRRTAGRTETHRRAPHCLHQQQPRDRDTRTEGNEGSLREMRRTGTNETYTHAHQWTRREKCPKKNIWIKKNTRNLNLQGKKIEIFVEKIRHTFNQLKHFSHLMRKRFFQK